MGRVISEVPRPPICSRCARLDRCPTPQACELAEQERMSRAWQRDAIVAGLLLVAVLLVVHFTLRMIG